MKNKKGLIIGIIVLIVVAAAGVGGYFAYNHFKDDNGSSSKKDKKSSSDISEMAGDYDLVEMSEDDETYTKEDLATLKAMGLEITMKLKDDGTGSLNMYGEEEELEFDEDNIIVNGSKTSYTYKNGKITLEEDGTKMVFEKK